MRAAWISAFILAIMGVTLILPTVTTLPFGMDSVFLILFGSLRFMADIFPPFGVIYDRLLLAATILIMFFFWRWIVLIVNFLKA